MYQQKNETEPEKGFVRNYREILAAEKTFEDFYWLGNHISNKNSGYLNQMLASMDQRDVDAAINALEREEMLVEKYQNEPLFQHYFANELDYRGELGGILQALRWVLDLESIN